MMIKECPRSRILGTKTPAGCLLGDFTLFGESYFIMPAARHYRFEGRRLMRVGAISASELIACRVSRPDQVIPNDSSHLYDEDQLLSPLC